MNTRTLAIATVVLGLAACGHDAKPSPTSESVTAPPTTASTTHGATTTTPPAVSQACTTLKGQVAPDGVCKVHADGPNYTIDMTFPTDYPDQQSLTDLLTEHRDQFVEFVEEPPVRDVPKALDMTGTAYRSAGTQSLVFERYENTGGAHPNTYYDALTYDLDKHAPVTFAELFKPGSDPVAVLDPIVQAEFEKRLDGITLGENTLGAKTYQSFALTDDAVILFIGQGMWAFEAAGPQQFSIPRSQLASILA